jgi:beta-glucuronidase
MLYPKTTETRELLSLDGIWQVYYDFDGHSEHSEFARAVPVDCDEVAVPASLNEQTTDRNKYLHMDTVWYFRRFRVPHSWDGKQVQLRFGSVNYRAEVYLNGDSLGEHETGYTPFEFKLPSDLKKGKEHLLAVRVDNKLSVETIPQGNVPANTGGVAGWRTGNLPNVHYDFFPFTGIHRPVHLIAMNPSHISHARWTTHSINGGAVTGRAEFEVSAGAETIRVQIEELGLDETLEVDDSGRAALDFRLSGVEAWCPEQPKLYRIDLRLLQEGRATDHYPLDFGFRTIAIEGSKFLLNGKPIFMRGFGRHEDLPVIGKGLNLPFQVKDYNLMRWVGANSFRTAHYPYAEEQLQMADRQGFLVIDETAANTLSLTALKDDEAARARLLERHKNHSRELIERDYNYASVVGWSLGNECEMWRDLSCGYFNELMRHTKQFDKSRPFTCVSMAAGLESVHKIEADEFDFIGYNTYPAWYSDQGKPQNIRPWLEQQMKQLWETFGKPVLMSEFGGDAIPGLHDEYCLMWTEEYQVEVLREMLQFAEASDYVCGAHIWNFADFKVGQHTGRVVLNWKGIFTRDRHPKAAAHAVRALWTGQTSTLPQHSRPEGDPAKVEVRYT